MKIRITVDYNEVHDLLTWKIITASLDVDTMSLIDKLPIRKRDLVKITVV